MKKKLLFILSLFVLLNTKDVNAFSADDYRYKGLCGNYEVAGFHADGVIDPVSCHNTFQEAKDFMVNNGADDLAIMTKVNGETKILDCNVGLLDMSVNPTAITKFYRQSNLKAELTYMDTGSLYGGVDAALLETQYNSDNGVWVAKVRIGNSTSWVRQEAYEVVPITWIKSLSSYTVTSDYIKHNYVNKIQEYYSGSRGSIIGPKPEMLSEGTYYSFDGHYFYTDIKTLIKDYKNNNYNNSINKNNPYYNYYMYLSNHTKTAYSSQNIDEYIRNNLGITKDAYGKYVKGITNKGSRLYQTGTFFYYAQEKYGVNALLSLSLSRNETGNGRSKIAIERNNGFGLNAVDSNPYQASNWYASFNSSILGYASKWVTYGYADPTDWRYFGPQFGDKGTGMNVKYASDTYWSEKMAANYYDFDRSKGLQDYNYYQLGVVTDSIAAYSDASRNSKYIYTYPEAEDALVIVGEKKGESVNGNATWYKVMSDFNLDSNFNIISSGNYNWYSYVYVPAAYVKKINQGKNGYIAPTEITEYVDSKYTYDLYDANNTLSPKVAISTKDTSYYYDPSLQNSNSQTLLKGKYLMVYAAAYNSNQKVISYLVSSDYFYDQREWVPANSIDFITCEYAYVTMSTTGNYYTWVNYVPEDTLETKISGLYNNAYVPILEKKEVSGQLWYKVPVNLSSNDNSYGWTLAKTEDATFTLYTYIVENKAPEIKAVDKTIIQGTKIDLLKDVSATDPEDGEISVTVKSSNLDIDKVGTYQVTYQATDSQNKSTEKTITITVTENKKPVITANDKIITKEFDFDPKKDVKATDEEDGEIEVKVIDNKVNKDELGTYQVTYQATDSYNQTVTKTINVTVVANQLPTINAIDKTIYLNEEYDELDGIKAIDPEDGDITNKLKVIETTVDTTKVGEYKVVYEVIDNYGDKVTKEIKITVVEKKLVETTGSFYFDYLKEVNKKLQLRGYLTLNGIDNTLNENINYKILFVDEEGKTFEQKATRIKDLTGITRPIFSPDGYKYTHSWFYIDIDLDSLPRANYTMYVIAESDKTYSKALVTNKLYKTEITGYKTSQTTVAIKNNYGNKTSAVTIYIRNEFPKKNVGSYYNQFDTWRTLEFTNNKLHIKGASYSYGMDLSTIAKVERQIIFENKSTLKTYSYNLSSITNGLYKVVLPESDNLDKTRAWYDANIDISKLEKGTYSIFITTTSNKTDVSELTDNLRRDLSTKKAVINDKNYQLKLDTKNGNIIELAVS